MIVLRKRALDVKKKLLLSVWEQTEVGRLGGQYLHSKKKKLKDQEAFFAKFCWCFLSASARCLKSTAEKLKKKDEGGEKKLSTLIIGVTDATCTEIYLEVPSLSLSQIQSATCRKLHLFQLQLRVSMGFALLEVFAQRLHIFVPQFLSQLQILLLTPSSLGLYCCVLGWLVI